MNNKQAETAAALMIGSELLSGKVRDSNLHHLAQSLRSCGVSLQRVVMVGDDKSMIATELRQLSASFDVVISSGGMGPTHDDVTAEAAAMAFELELSPHEQLSELLRNHYGGDFCAAHARMAQLPSSATLLTANQLRWPIIVVSNVYLLPGVPEVFRDNLKLLQRHLESPQRFMSACVYCDCDEAQLAEWLREVDEAFAGVQVGSYPDFQSTSYKTKVTFDGTDLAELERAQHHFLSGLDKSQIHATERAIAHSVEQEA